MKKIPSTHLLSKLQLDHGIVVFIAAMLALGMLLGSRGLNEPDEGRYSSVAADMLINDNWLIPHQNGLPHLTKPPLTYWLMAGSMKVFGVNEWAVRLVPVLAALGTVMLTWSLARRWYGRRAAGLTVVMLIFSPLFFAIGRITDPNMLLTFWIMAGVWSWVIWQEQGRTTHACFYYAAHAGAFLTKGPVGSLLIIIITYFLGRARRNTTPLRSIWSWPLASIAITVSLLWYVILVLRDPALLKYFLGEEIFERVAGHGFKRSEPFWYYMLIILGGFLPWLPWLFRGIAGIKQMNSPANPTKSLVLASAVIFLFFTIVKSKLATYILPLFPLLALIAGGTLVCSGWTKQGRMIAMRYSIGVALLMTPVFLSAGAIIYGWPIQDPVILALVSITPVLSFAMLYLPAPRITRLYLIYLISFTASLVVQLKFENLMRSPSSNRELMIHMGQLVRDDPAPVYYSRLPRSWFFYAPDVPLPKRIQFYDEDGVFISNAWSSVSSSVTGAVYLLIREDLPRKYPAAFEPGLIPMARDSRYILFKREHPSGDEARF